MLTRCTNQVTLHYPLRRYVFLKVPIWNLPKEKSQFCQFLANKKQQFNRATIGLTAITETGIIEMISRHPFSFGYSRGWSLLLFHSTLHIFLHFYCISADLGTQNTNSLRTKSQITTKNIYSRRHLCLSLRGNHGFFRLAHVLRLFCSQFFN